MGSHSASQNAIYIGNTILFLHLFGHVNVLRTNKNLQLVKINA